MFSLCFCFDVAVDLFQGQLKSTLVCSECEFSSHTFDPFMYLSVVRRVLSDNPVFELRLTVHRPSVC